MLPMARNIFFFLVCLLFTIVRPLYVSEAVAYAMLLLLLVIAVPIFVRFFKKDEHHRIYSQWAFLFYFMFLMLAYKGCSRPPMNTVVLYSDDFPSQSQ